MTARCTRPKGRTLKRIRVTRRQGWIAAVVLVVIAFLLALVLAGPERREDRQFTELEELTERATDQARQACLATDSETLITARFGYLQAATEYSALWADATQGEDQEDAELLPKRLPSINQTMRVMCPQDLQPLPESSLP